MKINKYIFIILLVMIVLSCSTKKDIIYLQDSDKYSKQELIFSDFKIKPDDILDIKIYTLIPEASFPYNKSASALSTSSIEMRKIDGYLVNNDGYITFPVLGEIKLSGLSLNESQKLIYNLLLDGGHLINHNVEVRSLNSHVTVLGEVNNPGTFTYLENNMNILKVIGLAGDLTINGKRDNVKLIRSINGVKNIYNIDLTSIDFLNSDYFQIFSGDILIINPNKNRIKNAGIIGNSGTLLSLLSFILSSIIVINN